MGEHALFTGMMALLLLGSFLVIALVMLWAPSRPFPFAEEDAEEAPRTSSE